MDNTIIAGGLIAVAILIVGLVGLQAILNAGYGCHLVVGIAAISGSVIGAIVGSHVL